MRVELSTQLPISAVDAWDMVQMPALLKQVSRPILAFTPVEPPRLPAYWEDGAYRVRLRLFSMLPMGEQRIVISRPQSGAGAYLLRDSGRGQLARRWDHLITIDALTPGSCRYTDRVEVEAGVLTPFVWAFAQIFYRHRQRRWRSLAKVGQRVPI